jgi:hypothetical protein
MIFVIYPTTRAQTGYQQMIVVMFWNLGHSPYRAETVK